jgi:PAS domain S-box-containing protein
MSEREEPAWPISDEELHRRLVDSAVGWAAFALDSDLRVAKWPSSAARLFGYRSEEIVGRNVEVLFAPEESVRDATRQEEEAAGPEGRVWDERWHLRQDGSRFWASGATAPLYDADGQIRGYARIVRDQTEWKRVRGRWKRASRSLRKAGRSDAFRIELSDRLRESADAAAAALHATEVLGRHLGASRVIYAEFIGPDEVEVGDGYVNGVPQIPGRYRLNDFGAEAHAALRSGGIVAIPDAARSPHLNETQRAAFRSVQVASALDVPLLKEGRPVAMIAVHQSTARAWTPDEISLTKETAERTWDAVERARTEARLRELNENLERRVAERTVLAERRSSQLRALAAELVRAEDRERRRLAELLHDHVQQLLVGAKMQIGLVRTKSEEALQDDLERIDELLLEALEATRSLSIELSPPILYDQGLAAALRWLAGRLKEQHNFTAAVDADPAAEPEDEELRNLLFQAARELLLNVIKHAGVSSARVRSSIGESQILLEVVDEGSGFDPAKAEESRDSYGLFQIRERIGTVGGTFQIESAPGQGTHASISVPYESFVIDRPSGERSDEEDWEEASLPAGRLRVLLVDDHRIVRKGVRALLTSRFDVDVVGEAASGEDALEQVAQLAPHVVLMDVDMPGMGGIEATRRLTSLHPDLRVIGLSLHEEEGVIDAMFAAGASRYVLKDASPEKLMGAIRSLQREE